MTEHIVSSYDDELQGLAGSVAEMGGMAEDLVYQAFQSLLKSDSDLARKVIAADRDVNAMQHDIEERAILTIARRQPMAQDLREIIAAIRIASDLERVADLAKNISRRTLATERDTVGQKLLVGVEHLAQLGQRQLNNVLNSYGSRNVELARQVWADDDEIDAVYTSLFRELLTYMMEDPRNISMCTHLLFCAKNVERIGDHATNIAETVHYLVTGEPLEDYRRQPAES
ncbi:MAG TPA: phosphate signaling complex protein PhoU [Afifellaceae bacterium]|nr:phosphate signaling complex protein PhoU [Afifellaceae bacterium]